MVVAEGVELVGHSALAEQEIHRLALQPKEIMAALVFLRLLQMLAAEAAVDLI